MHPIPWIYVCVGNLANVYFGENVWIGNHANVYFGEKVWRHA